jgi:Putative type VII ESX secretion system translocon, EccE
MSQPLRYVFPPPERRRVLGPFTAGQLTTLGTVAMVAVFGVARTNPTPGGIMVAVVLLGLAAVVVMAPVQGRTLSEWAPLTLRYGLGRLRGRTDFRARTPLHGRPGDRSRLPAELGDLEIVAHPWQERVLGVVIDRAAGLYTAALEVHGAQFLLETTSRQEELLGRWGGVLARLAGPGEVYRLQWILRTTLDDAAAIVEDLRESQASDVATAAELVRSYLALLATAASGATRHLSLVVVQVAAQRSARAIRQAGGGDQGACTVLAQSLDALTRELADLGVEVVGPLDARSYQGVIRVAFDPSARVELDTLARLGPGNGWGSDWPWPVATEERWGYYRTADRAWHRSFTLALPLGEVPADWFAPMVLGDSAVCHTVAMTVQPVPRQQANREVTRSLTRLLAEDERKQRFGQVQTAEDAKHESAAVQRMEELADGHAEVLYAVTVTVTASDLETLDEACQSVDHVAGMASCELRQLEGQQAQAFTWTLPLARGLD